MCRALGALAALLVLAAGCEAAARTGLREAKLCCGNDCVNLAEDSPDAWELRDSFKAGLRAAQSFPRVRAPLSPAAALGAPPADLRARGQAYAWEAIPPLPGGSEARQKKHRLKAGTEVRHTDGRIGAVVDDARPGGQRIQVEWTEHDGQEMADTTEEDIDPRRGLVSVFLQERGERAYTFGEGRLSGLGTCREQRLALTVRTEEDVPEGTEFYIPERGGEGDVPRSDGASGRMTFDLGPIAAVRGSGARRITLCSRLAESKNAVLRIAVLEAVTVDSLRDENRLAVAEPAADEGGAAPRLPVVYAAPGGAITAKPSDEAATPYFRAADAAEMLGGLGGWSVDRFFASAEVEASGGVVGIALATRQSDSVPLNRVKPVRQPPARADEPRRCELTPLPQELWISADTLMLRAEAVRDDAVRDRVGIIPDRAERCRQAAVAAHAEGGDFAAAYAEQASLRRCDVACWMETNTSAVATAVDATRVLAAWKLAVDAAPRRGDDRTRAVSIMAPFLRRDQAAALLADVGGLGSDTFAAARAWPSERTISLVKAPRHVRQDTEDENSVWVSLLPRGIGGAPGWVDAITHTRNRRCADGSRVIGAGSSTDIVDGSIVAEFVESIVVVRPPPPPPPPPPHSGARRVRIVTRECAQPRRAANPKYIARPKVDAASGRQLPPEPSALEYVLRETPKVSPRRSPQPPAPRRHDDRSRRRCASSTTCRPTATAACPSRPAKTSSTR